MGVWHENYVGACAFNLLTLKMTGTWALRHGRKERWPQALTRQKSVGKAPLYFAKFLFSEMPPLHIAHRNNANKDKDNKRSQNNKKHPRHQNHNLYPAQDS